MNNQNQEKNMNFNIYYLNFSKVYEISMMINNIIVSNIKREKNSTYEISKKISASNTSSIGSKAYLANIKSVIGAEVSDKSINSSKMIESLDIKTTKSILLREIISKCKDFTAFNEYKEGDLLKIDKASLSMLDEDTLRQILILRKDALQGFRVEGFEVNNLISSMLQDYSYILKGQFSDSEDAIIFKIPMEIESEFESKYNVDDLLIGNVSIVGVYKGTVTEDFIKTNTFSYFTNLSTLQQEPERKVFPSSIQTQQGASIIKNPLPLPKNTESIFHFIDIIAIIQDIQFKQSQYETVTGKPWHKRMINFLLFWKKH
jgi:hypothetical protein